ncbi:MAG: glycerol-3-phosphate dehydrogenase/oxidase [bacterium]
MKKFYDVIIIGAGINGVSIAYEMGLRGFTSLVIDKGDISSGTSGSSSKLIHGGVRYLQYAAFDLVRESLVEQQRLLSNASHLVRPLSFIMPLFKHGIPSWKMRLGFFLYDLLSYFHPKPKHSLLKRSEAIDLCSDLRSASFDRAILFQDAQMNDSQICIELAEMAHDLGVDISTYTEALSLDKDTSGLFNLSGQFLLSDSTFNVQSRFLINCSGPWCDELLQRFNRATTPHILPSKGVHILTDTFKVGTALALQNSDGRLFFALPWEGLTLIGTTETPCNSPIDSQCVTPEDIAYLKAAVKFSMGIDNLHIISSFSGVRPLARRRSYSLDSTSRREKFHLSDNFLSVYGGKYTTFRRIAEKAAHYVHRFFSPCTPFKSLTKNNVFSRCISVEQKEAFLDKFADSLDENIFSRLPYFLDKYGSKTSVILELLDSYSWGIEPLSGSDWLKIEVVYVIKYSFSKKIEDFMRRRSLLMFQEQHGLQCLNEVADIFSILLDWSPQQKTKEIAAYKDAVRQMCHV